MRKLDLHSLSRKDLFGGEVKIGDKFGSWTILSHPDPKKKIYLAECACGTTRPIRKDILVNMVTSRCIKCFRAEIRAKNKIYFGD